MTATITFYDAAYPPATPPPADGVCIYVGGDTLHVWTAAEIAAQKARFRLPVFVRSNPPGPGAAADVSAAMRQLAAIGAPKGTLVAWDLETAADAAYIRAVYTALAGAGYKLIVYGSQSTVMGNDNPGGLYWGADWTSAPHLAWHDGMTQYVSYAAWDESLASASLPFWDTRKGTAHTPAVPARPVLAAGWQSAVMGRLPLLAEGAADKATGTWWVRRVQGLVTACGYPCSVDGDFGAGTTAALRKVQTAHGILPDGICGPVTWAVLISGGAP